MGSIPLAQIHGVNQLQLDQVTPPSCGANDVIVGVSECGICGSDLGYLAMGGIAPPGQPMPIGHELWGEVVAAGGNVEHVAVGDAVVVQPMSNGNQIGNGGGEGGFSPQLLVRDAALAPESVVKLPERIPKAWGALVEPLAVATHGVNRIAATVADKAVIFGAGPIGLSMLLVLKHRGLRDIVVVDIVAPRLALAEQFGAQVLRGDAPDLSEQLMALHDQANFFGMHLPGTTVFFEATGVRSVFEQIVNLAGPGARICLSGVHKEAATIDLTTMLAKELAIVAAMGYDNEFEEVIDMLSHADFDPSVMITHHFPLTAIHEAFAQARDASSAIKVMVDCQA